MHARTRALTALLALVVLAAGCVAAPGATQAGQPHETPLDAQTVADQHQQALDAAGSYAYDATATATLDGQSAGSSNLTAVVEADRDRSRVVTETAFGPVETYVSNGTVAQRIGAENPQYRAFEGDVAAGDVVAPTVGPTVGNYTFTPNGTVTMNDQRVWRYEAHLSGENATLQRSLGEGITVTDVRVTLDVRADGLVVRQQTTATIAVADGNRTGTYQRTATYSNLGSATVERPDWVDEALNPDAQNA